MEQVMQLLYLRDFISSMECLLRNTAKSINTGLLRIRLDVSATYTPLQKVKRDLQSSWVFSIYNVYSRLNPYFVYFSQEGSAYNNSLKVEARQVSLFPIIPSITWNFKF